MNREEFKKEAKKNIDELVHRIDEMERKKENMKDNIREQYESKLRTLRNNKEELQLKYKRLNEASNDQWQEAKEAFSNASDHFKQGFRELTSITN